MHRQQARAKTAQIGTPRRTPQRLALSRFHVSPSRIKVLTAALALVSLSGLGCNRGRVAKESRVSRAQADDYLRDAVRMSSEGVLLEPRGSGIGSIERVRLGEIAQELRQPAAICFVERAIQTMQTGLVDGEAGWTDIPEGQIKIRTRIAVDGSVLSTEVLDSGFGDSYMEGCLREVLAAQRFPASHDSFAYAIDIYYWVSLGVFTRANSADFGELMRREQAEAGLRAKPCVTGRVPAGEYRVTGVNLFDRDGDTIVNRVDEGQLMADLSACVAAAFRSVRIYPEPEAFIRPAEVSVEFSVADDGSVTSRDERWLELLKLEERAERERRRAELGFVDDLLEPASTGFVDELGGAPASPPEAVEVPTGVGPVDLGPALDPGPAGPAPASPGPVAPKTEPSPKGEAQPPKPGVKIDLSPGRPR